MNVTSRAANGMSSTSSASRRLARQLRKAAAIGANGPAVEAAAGPPAGSASSSCSPGLRPAASRRPRWPASSASPTTTGTPFDTDAGAAGEWESSGILDVSTLFGEEPGTLFVFDVQAHGIEDQTDVNPDSRINDDDLVEGGQLLFLHAREN